MIEILYLFSESFIIDVLQDSEYITEQSEAPLQRRS